ncbi:MTH1187/YkoF-like protein [Rhodotorula toruloides]|uniref:MTH1187/YkoF-like protein n=1 Tax=Rhodotorula toruloides TaxID=5286 RepID=A0A2T0A775_RHOTO|nr:MTH1187/YkoF-like protein [Rhodotorula toruloides]
MHATADFCLVPMGTADPSVSKYIAECQRVLQKSGLKYELHGYGTGVEGEYSAVMKVIEECHEAVHAMGCPRVATDIRIGTRVDKQGSLQAKIDSVKELLSCAHSTSLRISGYLLTLSCSLGARHAGKTSLRERSNSPRLPPSLRSFTSHRGPGHKRSRGGRAARSSSLMCIARALLSSPAIVPIG